MKTLLILIVVAVAFSGCINQKYLSKNQSVFKVELTGNNKARILAYNSGNNKIHISVKDSADVLLIQNKDTSKAKFVLPTIVQADFHPDARYINLAAKKKYYFPETQFPAQNDSNSNNAFVSPQKLRYSVNNFVLQAVTTPIKVRPAFTKARLKDSLSLQALAELNVGISIGLKRTWGAYKAKPYENGQKGRSISLSGTSFVSFGGTTVRPITIRYYRPFEKTEPAISYGACVLFGFNGINIGLSLGTDHLINREIGKRWIYDGSLWYGVTIAYDLAR
ncbi:MAG TPA: hypothetical protein VG738_19960 [Chitinophagaceae bacterium]|nr:hypothetical protein [Chitinophagaceae bacterium]